MTECKLTITYDWLGNGSGNTVKVGKVNSIKRIVCETICLRQLVMRDIILYSWNYAKTSKKKQYLQLNARYETLGVTSISMQPSLI